MTQLLVSLDGGGTKTDLAWIDAAGACGRLRIGSGCNPQDGGDWLDVIKSALAALPKGPVCAAFGIPGYGEIPQLDAQIAAALAELGPRMSLHNDVALAYHGAYPDGGGTLALAGTGSMAMAQGQKGLVRAGGWGDAFGDEGSAYAIGRAALALASRMSDGRAAPAPFAASLRRSMGAVADDGPFGLMVWAAAQPHPRAAIAGLAEKVDALAGKGDPSALRLLRAAARDLAQMARAAQRRAGLPRTAPWSVAGSVFNSDVVRDTLSGLLGTSPQPVAHSALEGGLIIAARDCGWQSSPAWRQSLKDIR